ncbi:Pumilio like domain family member 6, partial [Dissostichus eleginoides]
DCVVPDNIEGYGAVQELAEFLFGLRENLLAFSGDECAKIITLCQALGDFDKRKTSYPPRHKNTLKQGRFRATKKIVAPGVESTKRCFIGAQSCTVARLQQSGGGHLHKALWPLQNHCALRGKEGLT